MEHTKHLWRLAVLLVLLLSAGIAGRHFLVPDSFGEMGFYRYDSLFKQLEREPVHGDARACGDCHDDAFAARAEGAHARVECETCHAPLAHHVVAGEKVADMAVVRDWKLCADCHQALRARPAGHAQIDIATHLSEQAGLEPRQPLPAAVCLDCHDPHRP